MKWKSSAEEELAKALAAVMEVPLAEIEAHVLRHREAAKARIERHRLKWGAWVDELKDIQNVIVAEAERKGYRVVKLYRNRATRHVAVMMQKEQVWNTAKGRMGIALIMVYPDGTKGISMERTISIKDNY